MKNGKKEEKNGSVLLWIERTKRILSFHRVDGYERYEFDCRSAMLQYAFDLAALGFRIQ